MESLIEYVLWLLAGLGLFAIVCLLAGVCAVDRLSKHDFDKDWRAQL